MDILSLTILLVVIVLLWKFRKPTNNLVAIAENRANYMVADQSLALGKDWHKLQSKLASADLSDEKSYNKAYKARVEASQTSAESTESTSSES